MVKNENFYTVFGWMLNELNLRGSDLVVYAIIYSFSQDGESEFKGSLAYISEFTGVSEKTIHRSLAHLEELGYIEKTERNKSAGLSNSYRSIVDLDRLSEGEDKMSTPPPRGEGGGTKCLPRGDKMSTPEGQNIPPIPISTTISTGYTKERKKEKEINKEKEAAADFERMSDEELLQWGEGPCDMSDPRQEASFYAWCNECRRRKETARKWRGKVIRNDRVFEVLKSHQQVMDEMGVEPALQDALKQFLRNAYLNKHLIPNDKLIDIICRLNDYYEADEDAKVRSVEKAINGGWYDIREFRR